MSGTKRRLGLMVEGSGLAFGLCCTCSRKHAAPSCMETRHVTRASHITINCPHLEQLDKAWHHHVTRQLVRGPLRRVTECHCSSKLQPPGKLLHTNTSTTMTDTRSPKPITFDDMSPTSAVTIDLRVLVTRHVLAQHVAQLQQHAPCGQRRQHPAQMRPRLLGQRVNDLGLDFRV